MSAKLTVEIGIIIDEQADGHFAYQILMDGHPYETNEACSDAAALTAAALWLNQQCKKCGCTFLKGCYAGDDMTGKFCHWVKLNLCSHCVPKKKGAKS